MYICHQKVLLGMKKFLKKNNFKIRTIIFENSIFTLKFAQIATSIPDLHLVCYQLLFDVHIVHIGHK